MFFKLGWDGQAKMPPKTHTERVKIYKLKKIVLGTLFFIFRVKHIKTHLLTFLVTLLLTLP